MQDLQIMGPGFGLAIVIIITAIITFFTRVRKVIPWISGITSSVGILFGFSYPTNHNAALSLGAAGGLAIILGLIAILIVARLIMLIFRAISTQWSPRTLKWALILQSILIILLIVQPSFLQKEIPAFAAQAKTRVEQVVQQTTDSIQEWIEIRLDTASRQANGRSGFNKTKGPGV